MRRGFHGAGEIDARNHGKAAHYRRLAGEGKTVLVVHRRPFDPNGDVAVYQILVVELGKLDFLGVVALLDHDGFKNRHQISPVIPAERSESRDPMLFGPWVPDGLVSLAVRDDNRKTTIHLLT
jgi:hypothetical protein